MARSLSYAVYASFALPMLWLMGVSTIDLGRILLGLLIIMLGILAARGEFATAQPYSQLRDIWQPKAMAAWVASVLIIDGLALYSRTFDFGLGFDHGIFMQAAHSFAQTGEYLTSFNRAGWQSFMNDHFAPFLAVPGALVALGLSAEVAILLVHIASFALSALAMLAIAKKIHGRYDYGILAVFILFCFPNMRHMLSWGTDIEYFGMPFILWAWWAFLGQRHGLTVLLLLLSWLCKESLTAITVGFCLMAIIEVKQPKHRLLYGVLAALGTGWFFLYTVGHHHLFGNPYFHIDRVATFDLLEEPLVRLNKLYPYGIVLAVALLLNPSLRRRLWLTAPAWPSIAMIGVSMATRMKDFASHYSLPPTMLLIAAAIACPPRSEQGLWQKLRLGVPHRSPMAIAAFATILALLFTTSNRRPIKQAIAGFTTEARFPAEVVAKLDTSKAAIISMGAVPHLLGTFELIDTVADPNVIPGIDYAIVLKADEHRLHAAVDTELSPCYEDPTWRIYCRYPPKVTLRSPAPE